MRIVKGILVGLAIFLVGTLSYGFTRRIIELYRIVQAERVGPVPTDLVATWHTFGFMYNPYVWLALLASIAFGIWLERKHGIPGTMKRLLVSMVIGFAFVAGLVIVGTLLGPPKGLILTATLLLWPSRLLVFEALNCPNADSIAEKLTCAGISLGISWLAYSAASYVLLSVLRKLPCPLGPGSPVKS